MVGGKRNRSIKTKKNRDIFIIKKKKDNNECD